MRKLIVTVFRRYFTSAETFALPDFPAANAVTSNIHMVAKFNFSFAVYVPGAVSCATTVGPVMDIEGMFDVILTIAPLTGIPA